jgi:hypothetical protein
MKRHRDALAIQDGACNPSGIAHSIVEACREVRDRGGNVTADPAIRLMVHQLAYICGITTGMEPLARAHDYSECMRLCREAKDMTAEEMDLNGVTN